MLDRHKLLSELNTIHKDLFGRFAQDRDIAYSVWNAIKDNEALSQELHSKKYSLLLPEWHGALGYSKKIDDTIEEYGILAVDGSQIYYDKHQGPECYLINVGSILVNYGCKKSSVSLVSQPSVFFLSDQNRDHGSIDFVNLQREEYELIHAWELSNQFKKEHSQKKYMAMMDGSLIFFQLEGQGQEQKELFLQKYFSILQKFYDEQILIAGYLSFPRNKELLNILKLGAVQFDQVALLQSDLFGQLTDMHVAQFFLKTGYRSTIFRSKAPISYLYPKIVKPYFCYLNVGYEIVRLEFPAWIAQQEDLVDQICGMAYDQAQKGRGYPVCLFEAHEQAVIKGYDRDFFYIMIRKKIEQHNATGYQRSIKSLKKLKTDI